MTQVPGEAPEQVPETQVRKPVPPEVVALAAECGLGDLRNARIVGGVAHLLWVAPIVAVASLGLMAAGTAIGGSLGALVGLPGLFGFVIALVVVAYALKTWIAGADDWYLCANGIVAAQRRRLRPIMWPEVAALDRKRMGKLADRRASIFTRDSLRGYTLSLKDGTTTFLTLADQFEAGKAFSRQLEELATGHGIRVRG